MSGRKVDHQNELHVGVPASPSEVKIDWEEPTGWRLLSFDISA